MEYDKEMRRAGLSAGTIAHRLSILRRVEREVGPLFSCSTEDLRVWLDRPLSDRSRYCNISHLGRFYRWAVIEGLTEWDPTMRITRPKVRLGLPRPIGTEDLATVIAQASGPVRVMLALAAYCGLRCCEIAALEGPDVLDGRDPALLVVHGKGGKMRVVPLHPIARELLRGHGIPWQGPVFKRGAGPPGTEVRGVPVSSGRR